MEQESQSTLLDASSDSLSFDASRSGVESANELLREEIIERKHAQSEWQKSEEKYRELVENAHDIIYSHDLDGNYTATNRAGEEITGYTLEETLSLNVKQVIAPEFYEFARQQMARLLAGEKARAFELEIISKQGRRIPLDVKIRLVAEDGIPVGITGIARDITERKEAENRLALFRQLVDQSNDGIYVVDADTSSFWDVNETACTLLGYTREELLKLSVIHVVADVTSIALWEAHRQTILTAGSVITECRAIRKDGSRVPLEFSLRYFTLDAREYILAVARDITERKKAATELQQLAMAVEQSADSIMITDANGNIEYVNPAFERITGYTCEEAKGQNPRILKSNKTPLEVYNDLWKTISSGGVWSGQLINKKKDGTLFEERATISAVVNERGRIEHYLAVKQDISNEIRLEEQLRQSQKMEAVGQLAGGVAHDFNNLLTAINGYTSLSLRRLPENHPVRSYLEEIKKAGDRATNLTRQLLAFGRKQMLQPAAINVNETITEMAKMLKRLIGEDIQLVSKLGEDVNLIKADPGQVEQVLLNIVINARDAMPSGGSITIETWNADVDEHYASKHVGVKPGEYVVLSISDTGIGISKETQERIFEPFFTTKEQGKGTGLGLSTVYGIVKQSGGNIWVYSELGEGTTFKVYLPKISTPELADRDDVTKTVPHGSETVLLVEDEELVRNLTTRLLEENGYKVLAASGGEEAIRLSAENSVSIDLLITDVVMPRMSGKEVADRVKEQRPETKVLFMSGYTDDAIVHHGVVDPNIAFIQKPFSEAALAQKIREVLDAA